VIIDGFPTSAAACLACLVDQNVTEYLIAGHRSAVKGHAILLDRLGLDPILDLGMRLGEGTGGALSLSIIDAAVKMANEMATFESANVSKGSESVS
jgi:nicotinate-nucleotide--dimethylbenzimidazole phosphoribosyltransferase